MIAEYNELNPLLYALFKSKNAFEEALEEYKIYEKNGEKKDEILSTIKIVADGMKKSDMSSFLPDYMRPMLNILSSSKFEDVVDLGSKLAKEYGNGKTTDEVVRQLIIDYLKGSLAKKLFGR